ncbi:MAG: glycosyltransferase [Kiloniellales bacterium]
MTPVETPLGVGVLVDLEWTGQAGGHVKCWERLAEAAAAQSQCRIDLSVHMLGEREAVSELGPGARIVTLPAVLSTRRFAPFRRRAGDATDLAPYNRRLATRLPAFDVLHATDVFAFARTALRHARRSGTPLVASLHTDLVAFTHIYAAEILRDSLGDGILSDIAIKRFRIPERQAAAMRRRLERYLGHCARVLVSSPEDRDWAERLVGPDRVGRLRRGIDKRLFHPAKRDRRWLEREFGVPASLPVVLGVGRLDASKNTMTLAAALRALNDSGVKAHAMFCGDGPDRSAIRELLGPGASLPGVLPQETLARVYASADVFAFPSRADMAANAVLEARASGLAVLIGRHTGAARYIEQDGVDGALVDGDGPEAWVPAIRALLAEPTAARAMGAAARRWIETECPSWETVLTEDLVPAWRAAAGAARQDGALRP